jgi:hypothetical protein
MGPLRAKIKADREIEMKSSFMNGGGPRKGAGRLQAWLEAVGWLIAIGWVLAMVVGSASG